MLDPSPSRFRQRPAEPFDAPVVLRLLQRLGAQQGVVAKADEAFLQRILLGTSRLELMTTADKHGAARFYERLGLAQAAQVQVRRWHCVTP